MGPSSSSSGASGSWSSNSRSTLRFFLRFPSFVSWFELALVLFASADSSLSASSSFAFFPKTNSRSFSSSMICSLSWLSGEYQLVDFFVFVQLLFFVDLLEPLCYFLELLHVHVVYVSVGACLESLEQLFLDLDFVSRCDGGFRFSDFLSPFGFLFYGHEFGTGSAGPTAPGVAASSCA